MANFSVILLTAPPPGTGNEVGAYALKVDQREILLRTVELFLNRDNIKQILVAFTADAVEEGKRKFGAHLSFTGVKIVTGGPKWHDQIAAAKEKIAADATHVILHDAARPCVPYGDLDVLLEAAEKHPAVMLTAAVKTQLLECDPTGAPVAAHSGTGYQQMLTPQILAKENFEEMCAKKADPHASAWHIVKGSSLNVRIGPGDGGLCKAINGLLPKPKAKPLTNPFEEAQW